MSLPRALVVLVALCASSAAFADDVDVGARVLKVAGNKATIDKGKKAGVKVGTTGELYPMRTSEGSTSTSVDWNVRLATAKVIEVKDDSSVVTLDAIADTVNTDSYFSYRMSVGSELAQSSLFRVTALGVELRPQWKDYPYITLEAMLADPSAKLRDATLDAMIKDVKDMKSTVEEHLKGRIEEGQFHGKTAGQVVDLLDRAQLTDFLVFVEGFPGKYIGHHWNLPEVYFTWVINGTPSGEAERRLRSIRPTIAAANAAEKAGKLDVARAEWAKVLVVAPDHKAASTAIAQIDRIQILMRRVASDPDDTAGAYQVMEELYSLGAYDLAMKQYAPLKAKKYDPFKLERERGYVLVRLEKWAEAEAVFKSLVKQKPDDKNLPQWLTYIRAEAKLAKAPTDPNALMDVALANATSKSWDSALTMYRKVLASPKATPKHREAAKLAQERIALQKEVDQRLTWARGSIEEHDIKNARERIEQMRKLTTKLGDAKRAGEILDELAQLARSSGEEELALELLNQRVTEVPDSQTARAELAYALLGFDRIDEAEANAKKAVDLKGDPAYSYLILSYCARARDDMAEMERLANKAAENSPKYPWPMLQLARTEAARGNWEPALAIAKKALELSDASDMRSTHAATSRGLQAAEALAADPKSERERLRLVRALAELGLSKRVADEIAKFPPASALRSDAWWSLVESPDSRVLLKDRLQAARNAAPATPGRKRQLAALEARAKLRANPKDEDTRIALAKLYIQLDDFDTALATLVPLMTTPMKPVVGDLVRDAREAVNMRAQLDLARAAHSRRDFEGAIRMSLAASQLHDRIGSLYGRLGSREIRADALVELGKYPEATKATEEARAIAAADGAAASVAILDQRLGRLKANVGTNEALFSALQAALVLGEAMDDETALYYVHIQLAELDEDEGRASSALAHARTAWRMAERLGRDDLARNARFQLADANLTSNRYSDSEQLATALLVDCRKHEDVANEQLSLMVLGFVAMMRGQGKIARGRFQEVYELGTRTGQTSYRALARRFEGSAWLQSDHDPAKAAVALEEADKLYATLGEGWASTSRGGVLRDLADARLQSNKLPGAQQAAEQALAMAQRYQRGPALASSRWMLALIAIKEKKADKALEHAQAAVDIAVKTDDAALLWNAWHALAQARELKGQDKEGVEAYEKALEHLGKALVAAGGEADRQGYMSTGRVRDVYKDAVALMLKVGKTARAMEILELSRDAQLKQMFDPTKVQTKDPKLRATLDKYEKTRARVQGLQKQLDEAMEKSAAQRSDAQVKALGEQIAKTRQEMNQVVLDLKVSHRHLFQALAMDPQNLVGRRNDLPAGSVLVEYFVAEDATYAFVISANLSQPAVVRVKVGAAQMEESVGDFIEAIIHEGEKIKHDPKDADRVIALGRKLDDWLLEPLRPHLKDATTLIILPFGQLYFLPFDALVVSEAGQPLRYAVEDFRISIQTATTLEHLLKPGRARSNGTMLAVSNPDGTLPGAQKEVARIIKSMPDAKVLDKKSATLKKFQEMAGAYRYLHLATHGILDADPRKSYLKMSDGPLTVEQISQLQGLEQTNELVVLSACDTANEQGHSTGDELISLAVAFAMAGSPSLVASLWEVGDESTSELMATFYRALEQKNGDRLEALRDAKLNLLRAERGKDKPFAPPWHWASFQMYGDFRAPTAK